MNQSQSANGSTEPRSGMKCLFLDPASNAGSIACVTDSQTVILDAMDRRITDKDIIPLIDTILEKAGWSYGDLTHLACATGPGGFTSLRTGIALLNIFSDQLKIPLAGTHLTHIYEERVSEASWLWCHSTRVDQVFAQGFGELSSVLGEPTLIDIDELASKIPDGAVWSGELIPKHQERLAKKGWKAAELKPLGDVLPGVLQGLPFVMTALLPWYGRSL